MGENKLTTNELAVKRPQEYKEVMNKAKLKQLEYLQHNESVKKLLGQIDSMLLEMDNMMTHDIFRHKLKASAKNFVRELEAWNSANFHDAVKSNTIESTNEYINEHEQIQEIFQSIHTDYRPHLINLLNKFVESGYDTEAVSKRVAKEQFTLLKLNESIKDAFAEKGTTKEVQLPNKRAGLLMVFETFKKMSFAIVLEAELGVVVNDTVGNP